MPIGSDERAAKYRVLVIAESIIIVMMVAGLLYLTFARNEPTIDKVNELVAQGAAARKQQCLTGPVTIQAIQHAGLFTENQLHYVLKAQANNPTQASPETCKALLTDAEQKDLKEVLRNP